MTGTRAKVPMGIAVKGLIDKDVPLDIAAEATPMVIGAQPARRPSTAQR